MVGPCQLYDRLPPEARRYLLLAAAETYINYLLGSPEGYEKAAEFIARYWRQLGIPEQLARRMEAELEAKALVDRAAGLVEALAEEISRGIEPPRVTLEEARGVAQRLYELAAILGGEEGEILRGLADELMDLADRLVHVIEIKRVIDEALNYAAGAAAQLPSILSQAIQQLLTNPLVAQSVEARVAEWARGVERWIARLEEAARQARFWAERCVTDRCRAVLETLARDAEEAAKRLKGAIQAAELLAHLLDYALAASSLASGIVEMVRSGANPYELRDLIREAVTRTLYAERLAQETIEKLRGIEGLGGVAAAVARMAEEYARRLAFLLLVH